MEVSGQHKILFEKETKSKRTGVGAQVAEHLPSRGKSLSSIPRTIKKKKEKKEKDGPERHFPKHVWKLPHFRRCLYLRHSPFDDSSASCCEQVHTWPPAPHYTSVSSMPGF
jgi:hypothetical protein